MVVSAFVAGIFALFGDPYKPFAIMVVEVGCLFGFGISWFVSGSGLLRGNDSKEKKVTSEIDSK